MNKNEEFVKELGQLINKYSMENKSNTPDFILASYIELSLLALNSAINMREVWYGRRKAEDFLVKLDDGEK